MWSERTSGKASWEELQQQKKHNKAAKPKENTNAYIMLNSHWIIKIVESNGLAAAAAF